MADDAYHRLEHPQHATVFSAPAAMEVRFHRGPLEAPAVVGRKVRIAKLTKSIAQGTLQAAQRAQGARIAAGSEGANGMSQNGYGSARFGV